MLTKEHRAHDLAIAMLETIKQARISEAKSKNPDNTEIHFDFYIEYKNLYDKILELISRDF
jgi:hypothetical protein